MRCDDDAGDEWSLTFWHDVQCNYLIRKKSAIFGDKNKNTPFEYEILEFREAVPGVFVPLRSRLRGYENGKLHVEQITTLSNVRVNEPIAKDVFVLPPVPAGTVLHDKIEGTRYPIDANWKPIGPKTSSPLIPIPNLPSGLAIDYHAQTEEEPKPLTRWLLPASIVVLAMAGACWIYRRWQSQKQTTART
jgi:hypothetical protein